MGKNVMKEFELNLFQLENKHYSFEFEITTVFFSSFQNSLIENGKGKAFLELEKSATMMQLDFNIQLEIELTCDVSLKKFWYPIDTSKEIIIKFGMEDKELSEDVRVIRQDTQKLNIAEYVYEFASLSVPMKKVHPDLENEDRPDLAYTSKTDQEDDKKEEIDPRWEALKKLKK